MEEKTANSLFEEMKKDVSSYVKNTIELGKLEVFEKMSKGSSILAYVMIILFLGLFALSLVLITVAFYIAQLLQSTWQGFGIVALITIGIVVLVVVFKDRLKSRVANAVVAFLMESDDDVKRS